MTQLEKIAAAMKARRLDLIAQPLDRVWPELARAAMDAMRGPLSDGMIDASAELRIAGCYDGMRETDAIMASVIDAALAEGEEP